MATLYSDYLVTNTSPGMVSTVTYDYWRNGGTQYYTVNVGIRTNSAGGWWNDAWVCRIWANGGEVAHNLVVKGRTSGTLGYTWYWGSVTFSIGTGAASGSIPISINYYTAGYSGNIDSQGIYRGNGSGWMPINPLPVVYLGLTSRTHNSITLNWSSGNIGSQHIHVYNGGTFLGQFTANPFTIGGLSPNTTYGELRAYGYNNGGYGPNGNQISVKTFPAPVSVGSVTITDINPFGAKVNVVSSNTGFTDLIEYSLLDSAGTVVISPITSTSYSYVYSNLTPETTYQARVRVRTSESGVWSSYVTSTFTTPADQAQVWIKNNGTWRKGKLFIKKGNTWNPAKKLFIKVNGVWKETTNN